MHRRAQMPPKPKGGPCTASQTQHMIEEGLAKMAQSIKPGEEHEMGETVSPSMLELKNLILEGNKAFTEKNYGVAITNTWVAGYRQDLGKGERPGNQSGWSGWDHGNTHHPIERPRTPSTNEGRHTSGLGGQISV
ncbi:hypothetical protein NDU88_000436 [Pleurodeles waltl]|uniref:Uncharacterized protein n=1 Tax=Pleurodeles waltl TaxID=8319 RepID=A0AAV7UQ01_PLEWA|nr:hypothetical protein NDU88_000436 [Pleurodeles waltl]